MRGDLEILVYNLIQWAGGNLPWKTNNLLGNPLKVQEAKESFMNDIDENIGKCFDKTACPAPILTFIKLVAKLKFDEKPNYESYRKEFLSGLKSLGKTNAGDLEFKAATSPPSSTSAAAKEKSKAKRATNTSKASNKSQDESENISPKPGKVIAKKRSPPLEDESAHNSQSPKKKPRASAKTSTPQIATTQVITAQSTDSSIVVHNRVNNSKSGKNKTYELNFELDISLDANIVVNVKRKSRKSPKTKKGTEKGSKRVNQSTDEIPATEKSVVVGTAKVVSRGVRTSPRAKK